jgi:O-antigen ligase
MIKPINFYNLVILKYLIDPYDLKTDKLIYNSLPFFIIAIISRSVEEVSFLYYAVPVLCVVYISFFVLSYIRLKEIPHQVRKDTKWILTLILLPGVWFLITALWSQYPEVTVKRALYFILVAIGSLCAGMLALRSKKLEVKSKKGNEQSAEGKGEYDILKFFLPVNIIVVLLCLFSLITNIPSDSWTMGRGYGFGGFFGRQNTLASVLLFTIPGVFALLAKYNGERIKDKGLDAKGKEQSAESEKIISYQKSVNGKNSKRNYLLLFTYCILLTADLILLVLTYSRASMLSLLIGIGVYLVLSKKWKTILITAITFVSAAAIVISIPSLNKEASGLIDKDFPNFYSSRQWLWEPSLKAALHGGVTGLGYGISDPSIILPEGATGSHYEGKVYEREKGNSTLALIEETGLIGLILFIVPVAFIVKRGCMNAWMHAKMQPFNHDLILSSHTAYCSLLTAALASFLIHSQFEAWMVGVGSVQLPLFFFYVGLLVNSKQ